jgi:hypothetical protein
VITSADFPCLPSVVFGAKAHVPVVFNRGSRPFA